MTLSPQIFSAILIITGSMICAPLAYSGEHPSEVSTHEISTTEDAAVEGSLTRDPGTEGTATRDPATERRPSLKAVQGAVGRARAKLQEHHDSEVARKLDRDLNKSVPVNRVAQEIQESKIQKHINHGHMSKEEQIRLDEEYARTLQTIENSGGNNRR